METAKKQSRFKAKQTCPEQSRMEPIYLYCVMRIANRSLKNKVKQTQFRMERLLISRMCPKNVKTDFRLLPHKEGFDIISKPEGGKMFFKALNWKCQSKNPDRGGRIYSLNQFHYTR
jgi:hypothetical protein